MFVCDKCNGGIPAGAKFCPHCGDPVTEEDKQKKIDTIADIAVVELRFAYSSSPNYEKALKICENLPTYELSGAGKDSLHRIALPISEIDLLINLYDLVGSWKSSRMLIDGQIATKKNLTYGALGCYRNRQKSYQPSQYCFGEHQYEANIWGCKKLNMPLSEWGGGWLEYGDLNKSGAWVFDKARIRHELEIKIRENVLCPVLKSAHVLATVDKLPQSIDPKSDKNWEYRTSFQEVKGRMKEVAVGIKPVLKKVNQYVIGDYSPEWETQDAGRDMSGSANSSIESPSGHPGKRQSKRSKKAVWWLIGIFILLYIISRMAG